MAKTEFAIFSLLCLILIGSLSSTSGSSVTKLRSAKRAELKRLVDALETAALDDSVDEDADARSASDADVDDEDVAADTSAEMDRLVRLTKREPFFNNLFSGLSQLAQNTAGALGIPVVQDRGRGNHGNRQPATAAPALLPSLAGAAGNGLSSLINGIVGIGGAGGGGGGGASTGGGMVYPSEPALPAGVVTISPNSPINSGAGDWSPAPMTKPDIDPISGVNITCPMLHTFRLENCGQSADTCSLDGSMPCKRGSICCPTMNCNLQCVFPENPAPRRGRCPVDSRPAIEHALFSGVIEPQSCYYDDHCPEDFKCCGPLFLGSNEEPRRYFKGARQVGAVGGTVDEEMFETKLCFPAENSKKPIG